MFSIAWPIVTVKNGLHLAEKFKRNDERVSALVSFAIPDKEAGVKRVLQQLMEIAFLECLPGFGADDLAEFRKRITARCIEFKYPLCNVRFFLVNFNRVRQLVVPVAEWRATRIDALCGFLPHSFFDFFLQIFNVIAGNHQLNAVYQLRLRFGILADDLAFFRQMNLDSQVFQSDAIVKIAVQAVSFLNNHHAGIRMPFEEPHHLPELLAPCGLGSLHVYKFADDLYVILQRIFPQQFQLRRN